MRTLWTFLVRIGEYLNGVWLGIRATIGGVKMDMSQVNLQLWTGAAITTDEDVAAVVLAKITADIDMREEFDDRPLLASRTLLYLWVPQTDDGQPKPVSDYQKMWEFAQPILAAGGVIYAHCAAGCNRGPSAAYFLLRAYWKLSAPDALALIKAKRPVATVAYAPDADKAITALGLG